MIKKVLTLIAETIIGWYYLSQTKHFSKIKLQLFFTSLFLTLRYYTIHRLKKINQEKIMGFKISFFDYGTFHFLFREVFLRNQFYFESIKKNPLIYSCGSNIGLEIIYFKWLYPESIIFCFEPDLTTFHLLEKNIKDNHLDKVHLLNIALSNKKEKISFYIDKDNPGWLTMSTIKSRLPKDKITVQAQPLSKFIEKKPIDFLTMDIEGSEGKVLEELEKTNKLNNIKKMMIEYHHNIDNKSLMSDFLRILEKNNFNYYIASNAGSLNQENLYQDILIYARCKFI